jgi:3D (Asp-Asp-Asp) domain-containing protein
MNIHANCRIISLKLAKKVIKTITIIILFELLAFPAPMLAANEENNQAEDCVKNANACVDLEIEEIIVPENQNVNKLPVNVPVKTKNIRQVSMTAYNSEAAQTDASPCITANGFNVCKHGIEDTIAANFLPMGTKVKIPDHFGDRVFIVRDRMHPRFQNRVDVWMASRSDALKFGVKRIARIEVIE